MKLLSLGIWSWDAELCPWDWVSSEARPTRRTCGWTAGSMEPWAFQECSVTQSPRSCEGTHFESALGTNKYFWIIAQEWQAECQDERRGPVRADRVNGWNVNSAGRPGDVTWHLFLCMQTSFWQNNMLLQFGDGGSRNCCWNWDNWNQELLNSLLSVGPHATVPSRMSLRWLEEA